MRRRARRLPARHAIRKGRLYENSVAELQVRKGQYPKRRRLSPHHIDEYGIPAVVSKNACSIKGGALIEGDPQRHILSYELVASRGCPFTCSYCCCVNLSRLLPKDIPAVRTRSVKTVIDELILAKSQLKRLVYVHFYDEVFPCSPDWINEFVVEYKKHVNLPFNIFGHPKMINVNTLKKLVSAGLTEVIMGVQSGSPHIRRDIFHRYETQHDIVAAVSKIREAGVPGAVYDFMLQHPFETTETLKETFELVGQFKPPFELQLHGLNFFPGTDIVPIAVEQGYLTQDEMDAVMYAPMHKQFDAYWRREGSLENQLWCKLIYCLQFQRMRRQAAVYAQDPVKHREQIQNMYGLAVKLFKLRRLNKKARIALKSKIAIMS
jgi:radical SAM superfamily enzyme YgiQ (UPF0313 family)